jgi:hypothetical protein
MFQDRGTPLRLDFPNLGSVEADFFQALETLESLFSKDWKRQISPLQKFVPQPAPDSTVAKYEG